MWYGDETYTEAPSEDQTLFDLKGLDIVSPDCVKSDIPISACGNSSACMISEETSFNQSVTEDITFLKNENYRLSNENSELVDDIQDTVGENGELLQQLNFLESQCTDMDAKIMMLSTERDILKKKTELLEMQKHETEKRLERSESERIRLGQESVLQLKQIALSEDSEQGIAMEGISKQLKDIFSDLKKQKVLLKRDDTEVQRCHTWASFELNQMMPGRKVTAPWSPKLGSRSMHSSKRRVERRHTMNNSASLSKFDEVLQLSNGDQSFTSHGRDMDTSSMNSKEPLNGSQCSGLISELKAIIDFYVEQNKVSKLNEKNSTDRAEKFNVMQHKLQIKCFSLQKKLTLAMEQNSSLIKVNSKLACLLEEVQSSERLPEDASCIEELLADSINAKEVHVDLDEVETAPKTTNGFSRSGSQPSFKDMIERTSSIRSLTSILDTSSLGLNKELSSSSLIPSNKDLDELITSHDEGFQDDASYESKEWGQNGLFKTRSARSLYEEYKETEQELKNTYSSTKPKTSFELIRNEPPRGPLPNRLSIFGGLNRNNFDGRKSSKGSSQGVSEPPPIAGSCHARIQKFRLRTMGGNPFKEPIMQEDENSLSTNKKMDSLIERMREDEPENDLTYVPWPKKS
eukprot:CAMPEP_0194362504 /NCGR_PEP_ID=MMETSP0174-20130528/10266_1 /TAXON_ID=216777 /ORGANISM="Proboscia alata, Strain PI-D3" /LENGTH=631 /DNA_ID=CAMNT_0039135419 /DNA_START=194 /DNA_END=2089 /DNA_ORIENTATION=-